MRHQDLTINHRLESFVYVTEAEREAAIGFVAGDVGRVAFQSNNGTYWRLLNPAGGPTGWQILSGRGNLTYGMCNAAVQTPAVTASTTGVMMGMGATAKITPAITGRIIIFICGNIFNSVADKSCFASGVIGTGTAPIHGVATPGGAVTFGTQVRHGGIRAANVIVPFSTNDIATTLVLGTQYWIDMNLATTAGGSAGLQVVAISAIELP